MFSLRREATKAGFHLLSGKAPPPEDVVLTRAELSFIIQVNICWGGFVKNHILVTLLEYVHQCN